MNRDIPSANSQVPQSLPSYVEPPVIEVVAGVQFEGLPMQMRYFGQFWNELAQEFPITSDEPPLLDIGITGGPRLEILTIPPLRRMLLVSSDHRFVLQMQESRFIFNWRKVEDKDEYPRYEKVIFPKFIDVWGRFASFVTKMGIGRIRPHRYELTYVNHIAPLGSDFAQSLESRVKLFEWSRVKPSFLFPPTAVNVGWSFLLKNDMGVAQANLSQAKRSDGREVLVLGLSCGGAASPRYSLEEWFAAAHEWIVRGFADLTTPEAQREWGVIE